MWYFSPFHSFIFSYRLYFVCGHVDEMYVEVVHVSQHMCVYMCVICVQKGVHVSQPMCEGHSTT